MPDYIAVPLVLASVIAAGVGILWVVLGRAARSMVRSLGTYHDALDDLVRARRGEPQIGSRLSFPPGVTEEQRREVERRWEEVRR